MKLIKIQIDLYNFYHIPIKSIYVCFDDFLKMIEYLEELTRDTDYTYLIHNGDNSKVRKKKER